MRMYAVAVGLVYLLITLCIS